MNFEIFNIVGIKTKDVAMPGRFYLSEEGDLTVNPRRAKLVTQDKLEQAIKEVKAFSPHYFIKEVVPFYG